MYSCKVYQATTGLFLYQNGKYLCTHLNPQRKCCELKWLHRDKQRCNKNIYSLQRKADGKGKVKNMENTCKNCNGAFRCSNPESPCYGYYNKRNELNRRNEKAQEYIDSVAQCKTTRCKLFKKGSVTTETLITIASLLCVLVLTVAIFAKAMSAERRYAIAGDDGNGNHFIYVTEIPCEVYEVSSNLVTVEYKGNLYSFYAYNTELEVGDEVVCRFTDNMEIYDTVD